MSLPVFPKAHLFSQVSLFAASIYFFTVLKVVGMFGCSNFDSFFASLSAFTTVVSLYNSNVKSVLLYGAETWRTTKTIIKKVQTFTNNCL
jgi:hypothetical protein